MAMRFKDHLDADDIAAILVAEKGHRIDDEIKAIFYNPRCPRDGDEVVDTVRTKVLDMANTLLQIGYTNFYFIERHAGGIEANTCEISIDVVKAFAKARATQMLNDLADAILIAK